MLPRLCPSCAFARRWSSTLPPVPPRTREERLRAIRQRTADAARGDRGAHIPQLLQRGQRRVPAAAGMPISYAKHMRVPPSERRWPVWTTDHGVERDWAKLFTPKAAQEEEERRKELKKKGPEWKWDLDWAAERPLPGPVGTRKPGSRSLLRKLREELEALAPAPAEPPPQAEDDAFTLAEREIAGLVEPTEGAIAELYGRLRTSANGLREPSDALGGMVAALVRHLVRGGHEALAESALKTYLGDCGVDIAAAGAGKKAAKGATSKPKPKWDLSAKPAAVLVRHYVDGGELQKAAALYSIHPPAKRLASLLIPQLAATDLPLAMAHFQALARKEAPTLPVCNSLLRACLDSGSSSATDVFRVLHAAHPPNSETTRILLRHSSDLEEVRTVLVDSLRYHKRNEHVLRDAVDAIVRLAGDDTKDALQAFRNWASHALPWPLPEPAQARIAWYLSHLGTLPRIADASRAAPGTVGALLRAAKDAAPVRRLYAQMSDDAIPDPVLARIVEALGRTGDTEGVAEVFRAQQQRGRRLSPGLLRAFVGALRSQPELAQRFIRQTGAGAGAAVEMLEGIGGAEMHMLPSVLGMLVERGVEGVPREKVARALRRVVTRAAGKADAARGEDEEAMELLRDAVARAAARALEEAGRGVREGKDVDEAVDRLEAFLGPEIKEEGK
ncbi:hypothetical protein DFJ74DRAFT_704396 [Hyaloraphidium curvatum]|nr:hypothetical protein DFJ74DRAFT_704396 [Hyaloraphidium curvatum]